MEYSIKYCDRCGKMIEEDEFLTEKNINFLNSDETGEWICNDYFELCESCHETYEKTKQKLVEIVNKKRCDLDCELRSLEAKTFTSFLKFGIRNKE